MHMRMGSLPQLAGTSSLTDRQCEALQWISVGKRVGEVALIMGITPPTVEKHLRLTRESLGVVSTAQAVLKAHLTRQLFTQARTGATRATAARSGKPHLTKTTIIAHT